ncbi:GTPase SAR1 family protein [Methanocalculus alkaliphilus]|uniref:dynamin family protein n=1 Tax=Methanocalculus alkaliphilus TaxID=768730 RepID=UPI0020A0B092|nr:dynamin family protein [Methanocalculus alkaliphilus]MCP1714760.1 GTPase SAR1 family protein [Methanocalculus alkaliphilus]
MDDTRLSIPENLEKVLSDQQRRLEENGSWGQHYAERLRHLEERLLEGRFHLAVLGQVKRGKSTLLNALIGEDVLPSSVIPLTALPTFIRYGDQQTLRVRYIDTRPDIVLNGDSSLWLNNQLMQYISEDENPKNCKGIREVEIDHPGELLRDVVLIDTPGIGSIYRHNTEATMNFLPQCDASLFVISADPPITEVEVAFLREVKNRVGYLFFVLNKVDYLNDTDRVRALDFFRTILIQDAGIDPATPIFAVSARQGLEAQLSGDAALWKESGLKAIYDHIVNFLAHDKNRVLREAIGIKAYDIFREIHLQLSLERKARKLPLNQLEERLALFDRKISEINSRRITTSDILAGDHKRVRELLENHIRDLSDPLRDMLTSVAENAILNSEDDPDNAAQEALADAIPGWFEGELGKLTERMDREIAMRLKEHQVQADLLIESIRKAAADLFDIPYHAPDGQRVYEPVRRTSWIDRAWDRTFSPVPPGVVGKLLPGAVRKKRARDRAQRHIESLLVQNLENLRWETIQNIDSAFRKFSTDFETHLSLTIEATHGAISSACTERKKHADTVAVRLGELDAALEGIEDTIRLFETT